ncbi:MAG: NADH-quinone oxidoreductase subunit B family protein [Dehalococcoidia bacterium]
MAVEEHGQEPITLPLFVPQRWDRPKQGRFFDSPEGAGVSTGKGNYPAGSLVKSAAPGVITGKLDQLAAMGRANSLWTLTFGLACCAIEMISTHMAHHDFDRFGVVTWPSPRQSDVMIVAGTVVKKMAEPIRLLYEQMPDPKWVIAMGTCATSGGPYYRSYSVVMGVDKIVPVDVYVPGCPPRPEALMDGIIKLQAKIKRDAKEGFRSEPIIVETETVESANDRADA